MKINPINSQSFQAVMIKKNMLFNLQGCTQSRYIELKQLAEDVKNTKNLHLEITGSSISDAHIIGPNGYDINNISLLKEKDDKLSSFNIEAAWAGKHNKGEKIIYTFNYPNIETAWNAYNELKEIENRPPYHGAFMAAIVNFLDKFVQKEKFEEKAEELKTITPEYKEMISMLKKRVKTYVPDIIVKD